MAARLSLDERVFVESSLGAGRGVADVAQRLGRDRSAVHRELARCAGRAGYDARSAHAAACARARRERTPKLAVDRVLAAAVDERLKLRWSPHATAADLREAGMSVCAQTIYRACYANDPRSGLPADTWAKLPRRARRRRPRSVAPAHKPSPQRSCAASLGTKAARWPAGPTSKQRSASRCSSASRARRGSDPPTSTPTHCCADGSPKAPASTSRSCASRSSRTTSTTCPADSTTGNQPPTSTLNSLATTARACPASMSAVLHHGGGSYGGVRRCIRRVPHRTLAMNRCLAVAVAECGDGLACRGGRMRR